MEQGQAEKEYLTFTLGEERYAVDILRVQELRGWETPTRVPNTPSHLRGLANLRGDIVPVYDLRLWLRMPSQDYSRETVVIIVRVRAGGGERSLGMVVDAVSDVVMIGEHEIAPTPGFDSRVPTEFITGLATHEGDMIMLLDLDRLAGSDLPGRDSDGNPPVSGFSAARA